jgi:hypothetical protein
MLYVQVSARAHARGDLPLSVGSFNGPVLWPQRIPDEINFPHQFHSRGTSKVPSSTRGAVRRERRPMVHQRLGLSRTSSSYMMHMALGSNDMQRICLAAWEGFVTASARQEFTLNASYGSGAWAICGNHQTIHH